MRSRAEKGSGHSSSGHSSSGHSSSGHSRHSGYSQPLDSRRPLLPSHAPSPASSSPAHNGAMRLPRLTARHPLDDYSGCPVGAKCDHVCLGCPTPRILLERARCGRCSLLAVLTTAEYLATVSPQARDVFRTLAPTLTLTPSLALILALTLIAPSALPPSHLRRGTSLMSWPTTRADEAACRAESSWGQDSGGDPHLPT